MTLGTLVAVAFLLIGFAIAIFDGELLFSSQTWFVAAITPALLSGAGPVIIGRRGGSPSG